MATIDERVGIARELRKNKLPLIIYFCSKRHMTFVRKGGKLKCRKCGELFETR